MSYLRPATVADGLSDKTQMSYGWELQVAADTVFRNRRHWVASSFRRFHNPLHFEQTGRLTALFLYKYIEPWPIWQVVFLGLLTRSREARHGRHGAVPVGGISVTFDGGTFMKMRWGTLSIFMLMVVTCSTTTHTEHIVSFPLQQWSQRYVIRSLRVFFCLCF